MYINIWERSYLKDPSQLHLCYCLQYRIWDRITRRTREKGQQYNLQISTRKTCHDSFAFILIKAFRYF